jgi:beta-lactamase superfamily II metal-dependent hydrolase
MAKPKYVEVRAYNVGFGDCFLLSFVYSEKQKKHVLIDFGSTKPPETPKKKKTDPKGEKEKKKKDPMLEVANAIAEVCKGKLHAVVATHRHKDHISGFATNKKKTASGDIIRKLADAGKAVVIQPWTEDPEAPKNATGAVHRSTAAKAFLQQLDHMHDFAGSVARETRRFLVKKDMDASVGDPLRRAEALGTEMEPDDDAADEIRRETIVTDFAGTNATKSLQNKLSFIGEDNVKNLSAVKNLMDMSTKERHRYLSFGTKSGLETVLPGVKVHVLGPPTIDQYEKVRKQRATDPDEFWMLRKGFWKMQATSAQHSAQGGLKPIFPHAKTVSLRRMPRESRWFVRRLRGARAKQLLELVLIMDEAMNNTSVILLFEVGKKKLLFPGDAQIENWEFALHHPNERRRKQIEKLLRQVDFYKVGHHGSRNATPKSLWNLFRKRTTRETDPDRMVSIISTKRGVHGSVERHTEVPRKTLLQALELETNNRTTTKQRRPSDPVFEKILV